jgi:hypothetical protein
MLFWFLKKKSKLTPSTWWPGQNPEPGSWTESDLKTLVWWGLGYKVILLSINQLSWILNSKWCYFGWLKN